MTRTGFPARLRMSHESRKLNTSYRRNGKLQSCEPCRKGKLRCDHMTPTCGRCARRNKSHQCVYHPAPLTKNLPTPQTSVSALSPRSLHPSVETNPDWTNAGISTSFDATLRQGVPQRHFRCNSLPAQPQLCSLGAETVPPPLQRQLTWGVPFDLEKSAEYLGTNSYNSVLDESELHLNLPQRFIDVVVPRSIEALSRAHIKKGADVLSLLKDLPLYEKFISRWMSLSRGLIVIAPIMNIWTSILWAVHHRALETQRPDALLKMSEAVSCNTLKPLTFNGKTTPREFAAGCTGENLRWEVVGIIFTVVGIVIQSLMDGDPLFCSHDDEPMDRRQLALKVWDASETCMSFCNDFDILNDLFLWFLYENSILCSTLNSKGSYANWQKCGEVNNACLAFGLHQEIKVDADTPFFITEFRKRMFIQAYVNDKFTATFVGRPPRLSRQYCLLQLPLDLNDDQIMADEFDPDLILASLDDDGWNQRGTVHRCTFARIFAQNAQIREEILELSLGVIEQDIVAKANAIEQRAQDVWCSLPAFLQVDTNNPWDLKRAPVEHLFLYCIRLEDLNHHYLIQRTLIKKANADAARLIQIAREIFKYLLVMVNNRDAVHDFQLDFAQILCTHGLPVAAVIAVELLRQERNPGASVNPLPRSDTIQDLSVLVACLGTVRPGATSYNICERGRRFLKQILDTVLSPAPYCISSNSGTSEIHNLNLPPTNFASNDGEFMRWLETMDWEQESWVNFD